MIFVAVVFWWLIVMCIPYSYCTAGSSLRCFYLVPAVGTVRWARHHAAFILFLLYVRWARHHTAFILFLLYVRSARHRAAFILFLLYVRWARHRAAFILFLYVRWARHHAAFILIYVHTVGLSSHCFFDKRLAPLFHYLTRANVITIVKVAVMEANQSYKYY